MFVHFGLSTYKNAELSRGVCQVRVTPDKGAGPYPASEWMSRKDDFRLPDFDAKHLVKHAQDAGMKYIVVIAKHHDGFHTWDTKQSDFTAEVSGGNGCRRSVCVDELTFDADGKIIPVTATSGMK